MNDRLHKATVKTARWRILVLICPSHTIMKCERYIPFTRLDPRITISASNAKAPEMATDTNGLALSRQIFCLILQPQIAFGRWASWPPMPYVRIFWCVQNFCERPHFFERVNFERWRWVTQRPSIHYWHLKSLKGLPLWIIWCVGWFWSI